MPKQNLVFSKPICNAPGMLGFSPSPQRLPFLDQIGAFFTNPISRHARTPASSRSAIRYPGGILLHSGFPNPGLRKVLEKHAARWEKSPVPVIPHVMAEAASSLESLLRPLEEISNLMAIEISFPPEWSDFGYLEIHRIRHLRASADSLTRARSNPGFGPKTAIPSDLSDQYGCPAGKSPLGDRGDHLGQDLWTCTLSADITS